MSTQEDIVDRLIRDLDEFRGTTAKPEGPVDVRKQRVLLESCDARIRDLRHYLELATDPAVDLAHEVVQLRERDEEQRATIDQLKRERADLKQQRDEQTVRDEKQRATIDQLEQERADLKQGINPAWKEMLQTSFDHGNFTKYRNSASHLDGSLGTTRPNVEPVKRQSRRKKRRRDAR